MTASMYAQQYGLNNFYYYRQMLFNPSATALDEGITGFVDYRDQWTGYKNAPETGWAGVQAKIGHAGLGLSALYERAGVFRTFGLYGASAYQVDLKRDLKLSLGANLAINQNILNMADVENADLDDPALNSNKFFETILQAGAGVSLSSGQFTLSLSAPDVYSTVTNKFLQDVFVFGAYQIGKENFYKHSYVKPFVLVHYSWPQTYLVDIGSEVKFNQTLRVMTFFRSSLSAVFSLMVRVNAFYIGYAYEANLGYSQYLGLSSHQITVAFNDPLFFKNY